jgi:hypothetical protein
MDMLEVEIFYFILELERKSCRQRLSSTKNLGLKIKYISNNRSVKVTFQSVLPVLLFARQQTTLVLRGRTDEPKSPAADYMQYILLPFLSTHFAIDCDLIITKRCCSNQSDGEMLVTVKPVERKLRCISLLEKGRLSSITGVIWTTKHEYKIVQPCVMRLIAVDSGASIRHQTPTCGTEYSSHANLHPNRNDTIQKRRHRHFIIRRNIQSPSHRSFNDARSTKHVILSRAIEMCYSPRTASSHKVGGTVG